MVPLAGNGVRVPGVSMTLKQNGAITQNKGVIDPFLKGHGDPRYPLFLPLFADPVLPVSTRVGNQGKPP